MILDMEAMILNDNKLNQDDFVFMKKDEPYQDHWFKVTGNSKEALTHKYMEMCMIEVSEVVYSQKEDIVGVKRIFPFNTDVITPDDDELKAVLLKAISAMS